MKPRQGVRGRRIYKGIAALAAALFAVYVVKGVSLYAGQRDFLYVPPARAAATPERGIMIAEPVTADGLRLRAWFAPPAGNKLVVVSFHGNGDDLSGASVIMPYFRGRGYGVFLCEYRGYSQNPGEPTEQGLYADARACLDWLKQHGYGTDRIVLHGHSLGTGVAVQMAAEIQPRILILESAFTSIMDMAWPKHPFYPASIIVRDGFDSLSKIGGVQTNLLMVHGTQDRTIPIDMGRRLFEAARQPKTFIAIKDGRHSLQDLYLRGAGDIVADWLDKQVAVTK